ncbi:unnamed protein product [Fraxinus pennsylvanica]|uniref:SAM domain-containing protein n=1 Tax=Fraxinus pennsylvanica TaxID=56036 RepID=A0AAD2AFW1_9LAMI|nr:unnamed protein product [Fraxinus pennsylvanica]
MGTGGGEAVEAEEDVGTLKRMRRPSVRFHQPYDEEPGNCMSRKQRVPLKKDVGLKKRRQVKTTLSNTRKNSVVSCFSNEKEKEMMDFDDGDVVIGTWRNLKSEARRKSIRPSISNKWVSVKSRENLVKENENFQLSSSRESENQEGDEEEKNSGGHYDIPRNFEHENSDLPSPFNLIYDKGNNTVSGDYDGVGVEERRRRLRVAWDSNEMDGEVGRVEIDRDRDGVRIWLNQLGLVKYAMLFEVHEVDDEILPLLTLEDLKDMGIIAVGSRRKMYSSIQKLGKGFS